MKSYLNLSFLECLEKIKHHKPIVDTQQLNTILNQYNCFNTSSHIMQVLMVLDYYTQTYISVSDNVKNLTGYESEYFYKGGLSALINLCDKDDFNIYNKKIYPKNLFELSKVEVKEHPDCIFKHDFRMLTKNNQPKRVQQRYTYITSPDTGIPLYNVCLMSDISSIKKDIFIQHEMEKISADKDSYQNLLIFSTSYFPESQLFSKREIEVLKLLTEGLNSIEISDKLDISESTISNHRKSMMKKSNSNNVAQLITFSFRNKII